MTNHLIVHLELSAKDPAAAAKFYSRVFGWETQDFPDLNYVMWSAESGPSVGFPGVDETFSPGDVVAYIGTDDIEASLAKVGAEGGKVLVPKSEIPGMGWFAMFSDPTGNRLGLYTSANPQ